MIKYMFLIAICLFFVGACVPTSCPPENAVIGVLTPFGGMPVVIPEGAFDDQENWMPQDEFTEQMEKQESEEPNVEGDVEEEWL